MSYQGYRRPRRRQSPSASGVALSFLALAVFLGGVGLALDVYLGVPTLTRLPSLPSPGDLGALMHRPWVPAYGVWQISRIVVWGTWAWAVLTLVADMLFLLLECGPARGAAWLRTLRRTTGRVMLPLARPAAIAVMVAQLATSRSVALAEQAAPSSDVALVREASPAELEVSRAGVEPPAVSTAGRGAGVWFAGDQQPADDQQPTARDERRSGVIQHTVQPGETLGTIAFRYYGAPEDFERLLDANVGNTMPSGVILDRSGVIHPGDVLDVPLPSTAIVEEDGKLYYIVEPGDTMWGICGRILGHPLRYHELFELNKGRARVGDNGPVLTNPSLIYAGMRFLLPVDARRPSATDDGTSDADAGTNAGTQQTLPDRTEHEQRAEQVSREASQRDAAPVSTPAPNPVLSVTPTPQVTADTVPTAQPAPQGIARIGARDSLPPWWPAVATAMGGLAAAALGLIALRRRTPPGVEIGEHGRVAARPARVFHAHAAGDPTELLATELVHIAAGAGIGGVETVAAYQGLDAVTVFLSAPPEARERLPLLLQVAAHHLADRISANTTPDRDVEVLLDGPRPGAVAHSLASPDGPPLVSLGAVGDGRELLVGWQALGHTLFVSRPGTHDAQEQLKATVAMLAACRPPERLALYTCASPDSPLASLAALPHQRVGTQSTDSTGSVLAALERSVDAPDAAAETVRVLVVGELDALSADEQASIGRLLAAEGSAVRVLAATTAGALAGGSLGQAFASRVVFYLEDPDTSVRVLGSDGALVLHPHGGMLVRLGGRSRLLEATGTELADEDLADLLATMGVQTATSVAPVQRPNAAPATVSYAPTGAVDHAETLLDSATAAPTEGAAENGVSPARPHAPRAQAEALAEGDGAVAVQTDGARQTAPVEPAPAPPRPGAPKRVAQTAEVAVDSPPLEAPSFIAPLLQTAPFVVQCMDGPLLWYRDQQGGIRLLGPGSGSGVLSLVRGLEVLLFVAIARLWQSGAAAELRGADKNELFATLWPNVEESRARRNLSTALSQLKERLAERGAPASGQLHRESGGLLQLNSDVCVSDVDAFCDREERALRLPAGGAESRAALEAALATYGGPLLPHARLYQQHRGAAAASGVPLDWLDNAPAKQAAGKLEDRFRGLLLRRGRQLCGDERWAEAAEVYREVLRTTGRLRELPNPGRGREAALGALEALAALGDPTALEAEYQTLQEALPHAVTPAVEARYAELTRQLRRAAA